MVQQKCLALLRLPFGTICARYYLPQNSVGVSNDDKRGKRWLRRVLTLCQREDPAEGEGEALGYRMRERDNHKKERRCFRSHAALLLTELRQLLCPILPLAQALNLLGLAALSASAGKAAGGERVVNTLLVSKLRLDGVCCPNAPSVPLSATLLFPASS